MKPARDKTRLPKWAQQEITRLERDLESAYAQLNAGPEDSDTFAEPLSLKRQPLGKGTTIEFRWGDKHSERLTARLESDRLYVYGGTFMAVYPRASNSVEIAVGER